MLYTVTQVLPGQIAVQFTDGTQAIVSIGSDFSQQQIDDAVSYFDPDFLPDPATLINPLVSVGQTSMSDRIAVGVGSTVIFTLPALEFGGLLSGELVFAAEYFVRNGITSVRDALDNYFVTILGDNGNPPDYTGFTSYVNDKTAEALSAQGVEMEEIFTIAMDELGML